MVNFNGDLIPEGTAFLGETNRGLCYGDAVFETIRVVNSRIFFWEDHYLRLMAAMRILRMDIPMNFTMEYLEASILQTLKANAQENLPVRVRLTVFRNEGGFYTPEVNTVSYIISTSVLEAPFYMLPDTPYEVELFKDHWIPAGLLSTLKSANKVTHVVAGIYAHENGYENCLLLNERKNVVEAINGNIFLVSGNVVKTPPLTDGCLNGIMRKQLLKVISKTEGLTLEEASISPFELQKADELFITNVIHGIHPITKYRKKIYEKDVSRSLLGRVNALARLT
ncbi:aminotransferase class IV [Ascidiimonas aurantiaca]|uniref:aminotransferase class IV n=1 Tax=Ascidiimonas aurantiaca TaxID=1685432 RepID=UPI0030EC8AFF